MGRKSNLLMERVYAHLSNNDCRKCGLLADPDLTDTLFYPIKFIKIIYSETSQNRPALGPKIMAGLEGWPVL
jgi:hypothetical protein